MNMPSSHKRSITLLLQYVNYPRFMKLFHIPVPIRFRSRSSHKHALSPHDASHYQASEVSSSSLNIASSPLPLLPTTHPFFGMFIYLQLACTPITRAAHGTTKSPVSKVIRRSLYQPSGHIRHIATFHMTLGV